MTKKPLFSGLIVDELDRPVETVYVGDMPCYVLDDAGFRRHIPSEEVDRQVLNSILQMVQGHEEIITDQTAKMLGQEDIFSRAMIESQLQNLDQNLDNLFQIGIPEDAKAYMGMMGLKIRINYHGEVIEISQPGMISPDDE